MIQNQNNKLFLAIVGLSAMSAAGLQASFVANTGLHGLAGHLRLIQQRQDSPVQGVGVAFGHNVSGSSSIVPAPKTTICTKKVSIVSETATPISNMTKSVNTSTFPVVGAINPISLAVARAGQISPVLPVSIDKLREGSLCENGLKSKVVYVRPALSCMTLPNSLCYHSFKAHKAASKQQQKEQNNRLLLGYFTSKKHDLDALAGFSSGQQYDLDDLAGFYSDSQTQQTSMVSGKEHFVPRLGLPLKNAKELLAPYALVSSQGYSL